MLKDVAGYGAWSAKLTTILDAEDCWDIDNGPQPNELGTVVDLDVDALEEE